MQLTVYDLHSFSKWAGDILKNARFVVEVFHRSIPTVRAMRLDINMSCFSVYAIFTLSLSSLNFSLCHQETDLTAFITLPSATVWKHCNTNAWLVYVAAIISRLSKVEHSRGWRRNYRYSTCPITYLPQSRTIGRRTLLRLGRWRFNGMLSPHWSCKHLVRSVSWPFWISTTICWWTSQTTRLLHARSWGEQFNWNILNSHEFR